MIKESETLKGGRKCNLWPLLLSYKLRCYTRISSPEKSRNNTREKISYFSRVFVISNELLTRHLPFAPLDQVDEWTAKPSLFSIQGRLSKCFGLRLLKHLKNPYRLQTVTFKLSYELKKTKIRIEKPKVTLSVALVISFLEAESENRQLEDLLQADSGRVPERFPLSVRTKSITENFVYGKLRPLFVFIVFQRIFSSWALAPTHFTIITRGLSILLFSFINKLTFPVSKGLLCLYDKENNTWLLVDMEFLFSCSTPHLTRSFPLTRELSSESLEEKFHIHAHSSIIL